ncbi:FKBP-type peptidyl-prolyl cis-trans isomerase [uncultured Sphingomonas sp.]|uniref:FKBP-type peptidyl-prolyl cis-trans isomerase n=1 Tax=uncultured Sphingomonas sp. TaxID=158754 RepID=UPI0026002888|nr:FKBP-type peptidyl-prolyl cis-trans isomerase [uncultured Sphingomonas sp.]
MARAVLAAVALLAATPALAQEAPVDRSQDLAWQSAQSLALASRSSAQGWRVLDGGLRWRRVKGNGSGAHPKVSDMVTLHYAGSFVDGTEFDSSYGGPPASFPLDQLIRAWQIAVPLMGVGDTIEIAVPAELGYGFRGKGPIPGGATLLFKIELLGIGG